MRSEVFMLSNVQYPKFMIQSCISFDGGGSIQPAPFEMAIGAGNLVFSKFHEMNDLCPDELGIPKFSSRCPGWKTVANLLNDIVFSRTWNSCWRH